jgi:3-hydroxyacyl-CoA dehydrogenase/enoyl-CoA hydratase/3-hydroxybutyryl-CoA epimerase
VEATTEYTGFHSANVIVEAVFEDVSLKHTVIRDVEAKIGAGTVLGSNTSTIPIATLAEAASRPENVIGLHFFSPSRRCRCWRSSRTRGRRGG